MKKKNLHCCSYVREGLGGGLKALAVISPKNVSLFFDSSPKLNASYIHVIVNNSEHR